MSQPILRIVSVSILLSSHQCQKSIDCKHEGLFLDSKCFSIHLYVQVDVSVTQSWLIWLCTKVWNWEIWVGNISPLTLFSFSRLFLVLLDHLHFHIRFRTSLLISEKKKQLGFWQGLHWIILTLLNLPIHECGLSFSLFRSLMSFNKFIPKYFIMLDALGNGIVFLTSFLDCSLIILVIFDTSYSTLGWISQVKGKVLSKIALASTPAPSSVVLRLPSRLTSSLQIARFLLPPQVC